eukprot:4884946-Prymnesium_polylepis.2
MHRASWCCCASRSRVSNSCCRCTSPPAYVAARPCEPSDTSRASIARCCTLSVRPPPPSARCPCSLSASFAWPCACASDTSSRSSC